MGIHILVETSSVAVGIEWLRSVPILQAAIILKLEARVDGWFPEGVTLKR
jgi:hypothetical protein